MGLQAVWQGASENPMFIFLYKYKCLLIKNDRRNLMSKTNKKKCLFLIAADIRELQKKSKSVHVQ